MGSYLSIITFKCKWVNAPTKRQDWLNWYENKIPIYAVNKKKCKNAKWLSEEALQIAEKREVTGKEKRNAEFQRIARKDKKAFLSDQCKEMEENSTMKKTRKSLQEN